MNPILPKSKALNGGLYATLGLLALIPSLLLFLLVVIVVLAVVWCVNISNVYKIGVSMFVI